MDNVRSEDIAKFFNISLRTYFRKKNEALNSFAKNLLSLGFTKSKLEEMFCCENWLNNLYNKNQELEDSREYSIEKDNKYRFFKSVLKEFNVV